MTRKRRHSSIGVAPWLSPTLSGLGGLIKGEDAAGGGRRSKLGRWVSPGRWIAETQSGHTPTLIHTVHRRLLGFLAPELIDTVITEPPVTAHTRDDTPEGPLPPSEEARSCPST